MKNNPTNKESFLQGMPEVSIATLVRRSHSTSECPHKGSCLTEEQMYSELTALIQFERKAEREKTLLEIERLVDLKINSLEASWNKVDKDWRTLLEKIISKKLKV